MSHTQRLSARCRFHSPANHPTPPPRHSSRPERRTLSVPPLCLVLIPLLTSAGDLGAGEITWRKDYGTALREAKQSDKPVLVQIKASWCGPCHKMFDETYADRGVVQRVNGRFVPVVLDVDADEALVEAFGVEALPTTVIVMPDRKIAKRLTGYQAPDAMSAELAAVPAPKPRGPRTAATAALGSTRVAMPGDALTAQLTALRAE